MTADQPTILATSMGLNRARDPWVPGPVFAYATALARPASRPKLCVLTTAGGDQAETVARFERAFADDEFELSVLTLFDRPAVENPARHLLGQDVVWVDRSSLVNLFAVWRAHGIDGVLREQLLHSTAHLGAARGPLFVDFVAKCEAAAGPGEFCSYPDLKAALHGLGLLPLATMPG
ncbi:hypothetical protein ACIA5G_39185 [Amycolatopsis sp. NPDC051758]|uniref:hypothetical protein n=1 Tax=Amycolatopsis sp. NPDC051758 TaxID=3363935 RepID=UPI003790DB7C